MLGPPFRKVRMVRLVGKGVEGFRMDVWVGPPVRNDSWRHRTLRTNLIHTIKISASKPVSRILYPDESEWRSFL